MAPKIGGNREIPAYFLLSALLKLLSTCGGVAELSARVMICLIALLKPFAAVSSFLYRPLIEFLWFKKRPA